MCLRPRFEHPALGQNYENLSFLWTSIYNEYKMTMKEFVNFTWGFKKSWPLFLVNNCLASTLTGYCAIFFTEKNVTCESWASNPLLAAGGLWTKTPFYRPVRVLPDGAIAGQCREAPTLQCPLPPPQNLCLCYLIWQRGLCRCHQVWDIKEQIYPGLTR